MSPENMCTEANANAIHPSAGHTLAGQISRSHCGLGAASSKLTITGTPYYFLLPNGACHMMCEHSAMYSLFQRLLLGDHCKRQSLQALIL